MSEEYMVRIPKFYLLTLAVHGNMGDGELPGLMRTWAERECQKLGLTKEMRQLQDSHLKELQVRLTNVLGKDMVEQINTTISEAIKKLEA